MKYIYLLLLILVLFYLFKNLYNKYSNHENFDPSLVPVSSIVTLAKVAQKLVDGGGTLTNPGNLQIGLPSAGAVGNLYVTGTNTVDGVSKFNNPVIVNGTTTFVGDNTLSGTQTINGNSTINGRINSTGDLNARSGDMNTRVGGLWTGPGIYAEGTANLEVGAGSGNVFIGSSNSNPPNNLTVTGNSIVNGNSTVNGTTTLNGATRLKSGVWHTDSEGNKRLHFGLNTNSFYESANGWHNFRNSSDVDTMTLDPSGNLNIGNTINTINLNNLLNTIHFHNAWYGDSWTGDTATIGDALKNIIDNANKAALKNPNNGVSCNYKVGTDINGTHYNTQNNGSLYSGQNAWVDYTCGLNSINNLNSRNIKRASGYVDQTITLSCP